MNLFNLTNKQTKIIETLYNEDDFHFIRIWEYVKQGWPVSVNDRDYLLSKLKPITTRTKRQPH